MIIKKIISVFAAGALFASSMSFTAFSAGTSWQDAYFNEILNHYDPDDGAFSLYDIDCNGVPELFIRTNGTGSYEFEVYTYANQNLSYCNTLYVNMVYKLPDSKEILGGISLPPRGGAYGYNESTVYQLNGITLTKTLSFGTKINADDGSVNAYTLNGNSTSYTEYQKYESQYNPEHLSELSFHTIQGLIGGEGQEIWAYCVKSALSISQVSEPWKKAYIAWLEESSFLNMNQERSGSEPVCNRTHYSLIDFDQNGIPELVTADKGQNYINDQPQVYTYSNGQMIQVSEYVDSAKFGPGWWSIYSPSLYANTQYEYYYCNYESTMLFFKYDGRKFILEAILQHWDNEYKIDGYSTTKSNYDKKLQEYQSVLNTGFKVSYEYDISDITPVVNYKKADPPVQTTRTTTTTAVTTQSITAYDTAWDALHSSKLENIIAGGRFECNAGDEIDFPFFIHNNTGFAGGGMCVQLDSALTLIKTTDSSGDEIIGRKGAVGEKFMSKFSYGSVKNIIGWGAINSKSVRDNGDLFTIRVKVPEDALPGTVYPVKILVDKWVDLDRQSIPVNIYDGWIHVYNGAEYQPTAVAAKTTLGIDYSISPELLVPAGEYWKPQEYDDNYIESHLLLGDANLDEVISIKDVQLILTFYVNTWLIQESEQNFFQDYYDYYYIRFLANKSENYIRFLENNGGIKENVIYDIMNVSRRTGRNAADPFEDPPKVDVEDAMCVLEYYTKTYVARYNTSWADILGYDPYDNLPSQTTKSTTTTTPMITTTTTTVTTTTSQTTTSSATTVSKPLQSPIGDLNGDQSLSIADAVLLLRFVTESMDESEIPSEERLNAADMDQDGTLTIIDVMQILRRIT